MADVLGNTSVLEKVKDVLEADTTLMTYLKLVSVNIVSFYQKISQVMTPAVVLNDLGEAWRADVADPIQDIDKAEIKQRIYQIECNVMFRYLDHESLLIGNSEEVGLIGMSKLVEDAVVADRTLGGTIWDLRLAPWTVVIGADPTGNLQLIGRQTTLTYIAKPEIR